MKKSDNEKINKLNNANSGPNTFSVDSSERLDTPMAVSAENLSSCPETVEEMINTYGTYNIQPTADTFNDFPAIAQGEAPEMKKRPLDFFRDGDDTNPASDMTGEDWF